MTPLLLSCRQCAASIDARGKAALVAQLSRPVLLDLVCQTCGLRALYDSGTTSVHTGTGPVRMVLNSPPDRA